MGLWITEEDPDSMWTPVNLLFATGAFVGFPEGAMGVMEGLTVGATGATVGFAVGFTLVGC